MKNIIPMKTIRKVRNILQQGDARYEDFDGALMVATFLEHDAITLKKEWVEDIEVLKEEMMGVTSPQEDYKVIAKRHLEKLGYNFVGYEVTVQGGRVDVLARKVNKTLAVECCSCRILKAIHLLENENTKLWVLSHNMQEFPINRLPLYTIERGPNWERYIKLYDKYRLKQSEGIDMLKDLEDG